MDLTHEAALGIDSPCAWAVVRSGAMNGSSTCDVRWNLRMFLEKGVRIPLLIRLGVATVHLKASIRGNTVSISDVYNFHPRPGVFPAHPIGLLVRAAVKNIRMGFYEDYPEECHPVLDEVRERLPDNPVIEVNGRPLLVSPEALVHLLRLCAGGEPGDCTACGFQHGCPRTAGGWVRAPGEDPRALVDWAMVHLRGAGVDPYHVLTVTAARAGHRVTRGLAVWMAARMGYARSDLLHDGSRVYCLLCGRSFATLPQARRHMEAVHGVGDAPIISHIGSLVEFVEEAKFIWCGLETHGPVWRVLRGRSGEERALLLLAVRSLWGNPGHVPQVAEIYIVHSTLRSRLREEGLIDVERGPTGDFQVVATDKLLDLLMEEAERNGRWLS